MTSVASVFAPTEKQRAFFLKLADSPLWTDAERRDHLAWFLRHGTKYLVADQIRVMKQMLEDRRSRYSADWFGDAPLAPAEQERNQMLDEMRGTYYGGLMPEVEG